MMREAIPMLVVLAALLLVGCAAPSRPVVYQGLQVDTPVAVPCRAALPDATPALADEGQPRAAWLAGALAQRERLLAEAAQLRAALVACGAPKAQAPAP